MTDFIGVIQYFVIVVGIWFFDSIIMFVITLTGDEMDCGSNNDDETKLMNGYKLVLKSIRFFQTEKNKCFAQN